MVKKNINTTIKVALYHVRDVHLLVGAGVGGVTVRQRKGHPESTQKARELVEVCSVCSCPARVT